MEIHCNEGCKVSRKINGIKTMEPSASNVMFLEIKLFTGIKMPKDRSGKIND